uniref:Glycosyltransferases n=1 Tax=Rhizophora mucronata TaxID=61149 RepID=A0A2P2JC47_RHIMU
MTSIRRTLSPVPRAGSLLSGEACPSPLSKTSSFAQNHAKPGGLLSSIFGLSDSQAVVLGTMSPRSTRPLDRSKPRGQWWRRALFHFVISFMAGIFIGITLFVSVYSSTHLLSMHQAFSFGIISTVGDSHMHDGWTGTVMPVVESNVTTNATLDPSVKEQEVSGIARDAPVNRTLPKNFFIMSPKLLIIVTPTYAQSFEAYYLNRLAHTLKLVQPPLLWIVVEMTAQSEQTADILRHTGVMYRHLVCDKNATDMRDKRVHQRNVALSHIETHRLEGIVYFADDDNFYSADIFKHMRQIIRFGTWTVAKLTEDKSKAFLEGPICKGTRVIGWHVNESSMRMQRFYADLSGFAFNSAILWDHMRWHRPTPDPIRQLDTARDDLQVTIFSFFAGFAPRACHTPHLNGMAVSCYFTR